MFPNDRAAEIAVQTVKEYKEMYKAALDRIEGADAVVIGAGAGLSTSAGFTYSGARFEKYFADM